jgi:hypothetical protein
MATIKLEITVDDVDLEEYADDKDLADQMYIGFCNAPISGTVTDCILLSKEPDSETEHSSS